MRSKSCFASSENARSLSERDFSVRRKKWRGSDVSKPFDWRKLVEQPRGQSRSTSCPGATTTTGRGALLSAASSNEASSAAEAPAAAAEVVADLTNLRQFPGLTATTAAAGRPVVLCSPPATTRGQRGRRPTTSPAAVEATAAGQSGIIAEEEDTRHRRAAEVPEHTPAANLGALPAAAARQLQARD